MTILKRDFAFSVKEISDTGSFSGYGSVFGVVDSYGEIVAKGAFRDSLEAHKSKGTMPAMLWQHRSSEPMGVFTKMEEDSVGLYLEGNIAMKTQRGAEAYELLKMGAITGLSIGFVPRNETRDKVTGITTLTAVDLWETSLVTFPANDAARVQGVKSIELISDIRSAEKYLRDSGLSRSEAVAFIGRVKSLTQSDSDEGDLQLLTDALARRNFKS
jgi:HK97 family phage prohead protease